MNNITKKKNWTIAEKIVCKQWKICKKIVNSVWSSSTYKYYHHIILFLALPYQELEWVELGWEKIQKTYLMWKERKATYPTLINPNLTVTLVSFPGKYNWNLCSYVTSSYTFICGKIVRSLLLPLLNINFNSLHPRVRQEIEMQRIEIEKKFHVWTVLRDIPWLYYSYEDDNHVFDEKNLTTTKIIFILYL